MAPTAKAEIRHLDAFGTMVDSFVLMLSAENRSPATIRAYRVALLSLRDWLAAENRPTDPVEITRKDITGWVSAMLATRKESSVSMYWSALHRFFGWLADEEEIENSPMARMKPPRVHDKPVEFLSNEEIAALLKACGGTDFGSRRDTALIRIGVDCGLRRSEFAWLAVEDIDVAARTMAVKVKGGDLRPAYFGNRTAQAIDRYMRTRAKHPHAQLTIERDGVNGERETVRPLFLTNFGGISSDGVADVVERRARQAGIERHVHAHMLRHAFANSLKEQNASDEVVMKLGGWKDARIMRKYASSAADRRAQQAHARMSPGDRI